MTITEAAVRREESLKRLESLGWVFHVKGLGRHCGVYNPKIRDGHTSWFNGDDALDKCIRFASMAQARAEAGKEKSK